jgi:hypothetical protein
MAAWRAPDAAGAVLSAPAATRETLPGEGALRIALRDDVNLEAEDGANLRVKSPFGSLLLKNVAPGARAALDALSAGNATLDALSETVIATDGGQSLALFYHYLDRHIEALPFRASSHRPRSAIPALAFRFPAPRRRSTDCRIAARLRTDRPASNECGRCVDGAQSADLRRRSRHRVADA